jgi:hypothetical protein
MNRSKLQGDMVAAVIVGANKQEQLRVVGCWSSGSESGRTDFNSGPVQRLGWIKVRSGFAEQTQPDPRLYPIDSKREGGRRFLFLLG